MDHVERRLDRLRGATAPRRHNARTIAALAANPGCERRAVLDSAGVDKQRLAFQVDFPAQTGQSQFAITRGNVFEAQVKADGGAELLRLLRELLDLPIAQAGYTDLSDGAGNAERHARSRELLAAAADRTAPGVGTLFDHPLLRLEVAGQRVYLEPDLIAFQLGGRFHVVEIKSFAVVDGQADPGKVSAAAIQSAVYVLAMREMLVEAGHDPELVSPNVVLVCPRDFSNEPVGALLDVRKQLLVLRRQLARMARVEELLAALPDGLSFDLEPDADGRPTRSAASLTTALGAVRARYAPECLAACELARFCRHEAASETATLGRSIREALGGVERVETVLGLASGELTPAPEQAEAAALLRTAARLRAEVLAP
ncbi:hypothetical protein AB0J86_06275 [Micromonospora sp. NPDC049559]|uniref:hypothetical protein n=1 Tax=Micromonospora sp. NPDC049559 TaxID=3155923 RepID=UPI00342AB494